ncbi:hypothetical protein JDW21_18825 [Bacillus subtilis]|uniref:hypothetical protein n=1 Tax=Bacillus subtilis TaxID=1423 RepID=UPI002ED0EE1D
MSKKIAPMWQVGEVLFHYSDEFRANSRGETSLVWVVMDRDYFIGTEQLAENFAHAIFNSENDAESYINE